MPTITAQTIIDRAELVLNDAANVRWTAPELLGYLNEGQRHIVAVRADANPKLANATLVAGTRQSLPSDGHALMDIVRNMGAGGATPGAPISRVKRAQLDDQAPSWHSATPTTTIVHFTHDPRHPRIFFVYPPAQAGVQIEILYGAAPTDVAALGSAITLDDIYAGPLLDYILYRAFSKDAELAGAAARAVAHYEAFKDTLGLKAQSDAAAQVNTETSE